MSKNRTLFLADYCLTPFERIPTGGILCERDKILAIGGASAFSRYEDGLEIIDMKGCYAMPGFIDSHIHGTGPIDTADAGTGSFKLSEMSRRLVKHGVTTFLPTLISLPGERLLRAVDDIASQIESGCPDADVPGIHLEGPFLNPAKRGSQSAGNLMNVDPGFARELIETGRNRIKIMTFAPELERSVELVELLLQNGVIPSMGHSMADEAETLRCIEAGALRCTYVFNGMPPLSHKKSSLTDVALTDDRVSVEMIVDGLHVHPRMIDIAARCKPKDKLIGISNSVSPAGSAEIEGFRREGQMVEIIRNREGVITGSTLTLENSWLQLMSYAKLEQSLAAACFTSNPAADLGLITRGEIKPGKRADIAFFDTKTNQVRMTVSRGRIIYRKNDAE